MSVSMTIVSKTMAVVSQTMTIVSQTMSIVSKTVSVSVVRISLSISLSLRLPLVQPVNGLEGVSTRVELTNCVSGSEVAQTMDVVETKTNCVSDHDTDTR